MVVMGERDDILKARMVVMLRIMMILCVCLAKRASSVVFFICLRMAS